MERGLGQDRSSATNGGALLGLPADAGGELDIAIGTVPIAQAASSGHRMRDDPRHSVPSAPINTKAVAARLRRLREAAGYATAADFARAHDLNTTTYYHHENGRRELKASVARRYAALLKQPAGLLLYGERLQSVVAIPIVGKVADGGKIATVFDNHPMNQSVILPDAADLVGLIVVGNDLYPAYRDGDTVFHRPLHIERFAPELLHGLECVVQLASGDILLRQIAVQTNGRLTLLAYHAPPLFDQDVVAIAPVELVQRHLPRYLTNGGD
jgi:DNA-binding XRE family transcriptional regulator